LRPFRSLTCGLGTLNPLPMAAYFEWVRADDGDLVTSGGQCLHDSLEGQLVADGRRGEDAQDSSPVRAGTDQARDQCQAQPQPRHRCNTRCMREAEITAQSSSGISSLVGG
jgi:hypothetical protein